MLLPAASDISEHVVSEVRIEMIMKLQAASGVGEHVVRLKGAGRIGMMKK